MATPTTAELTHPSTPVLDTSPEAESPGALGDLNSPEFAGTLRLSPSLPDGLILLSQWLAEVPEDELFCVLSDYQQAVRTTIEALPVRGETFNCTFTDPKSNQGRPTQRKVDEELIRDTPEARQWLREKRTETRLAIMRHTGKMTLAIEDLVADRTQFDRLLAERRAYLEQQTSAPEAPKTSPKPPARTRSKAKRSSQ